MNNKEILSEIKNNCYNSEYFDKCGAVMPNREVIIDILKKIRRVLFPGYFGKETIDTYIDDVDFILDEIRISLKKQIVIAYKYVSSCSDSLDFDKIAEDIVNRFVDSLPSLQTKLLGDVQAIYNGDPAVKYKPIIISSYPGMLAIFVYRIAHILYVEKVPLIPRMMTEYAHSRTGIDINSGAVIGDNFFIDHGTGIVIGETTVIGNNVKLYQGVTLGALSTRKGHDLIDKKRHPTIGNNVTIYSGASVLGGNTVIGDNCIIGGNTFITESVPENTKVTLSSNETKNERLDAIWEI